MKMIIWGACMSISLAISVGAGLTILLATESYYSTRELFAMFVFSLLSSISSGLAIWEHINEST